MKKEKSKYEGNTKILKDEAAYLDRNTVLLIDLLAELAVATTLAKANFNHYIPPSPLPPDWNDAP